MAKRDGASIDFAWVLLDAGHASHAGRLTALQAKHEAGWGCKLSVAQSADASEALVKVAWADSGWVNAFKASAIRIFTEADHAEARAMVRGWDVEKGAPVEARAG